MKILLVGGGGREHALAWKIKQSPLLKELYCAPGNPGMAELGNCIGLKANDIPGLLAFAKERRIDLTVVGPEDPLAQGIVDAFEKDGLKIFGPSRSAARLESSKAFAKQLLEKKNVPASNGAIFSDWETAVLFIRTHGAPVVVKADGLAAGKGVVVARTEQEGYAALEMMMKENALGEAGKTVVIEEFLEGEEASVLAFVDGEHVLPLLPAQDHKPVFDDDKGPNTGGMGAYAPTGAVKGPHSQVILDKIFHPTLEGLRDEGVTYRGILYAGLMMTREGPRVIEYNCRFGDPEVQPLMMLLENDLLELLLATCEGRLDKIVLKWKPGASVCVVLASKGYPGAYEKGKEITGIAEAEKEGAVVFHAGTAEREGKLCTAGGRVLGVTAQGETFTKALDKTYRAVGKVRFEGAHFRKDIGLREYLRP
jgi:phosphoribosylamine--glycine ligase